LEGFVFEEEDEEEDPATSKPKRRRRASRQPVDPSAMRRSGRSRTQGIVYMDGQPVLKADGACGFWRF
jgi:hypothetical protein